jgi:hypothetical protein
MQARYCRLWTRGAPHYLEGLVLEAFEYGDRKGPIAKSLQDQTAKLLRFRDALEADPYICRNARRTRYWAGSFDTSEPAPDHRFVERWDRIRGMESGGSGG